MKRLLIPLCLIAATAGCWLGVHLAGAPAGGTGRAAPSPPWPAPTAPPAPATAAKAPGVSSASLAARPTGKPVGATLLAAYRSSPNYRAFIYQAMKVPQDGGYYFSGFVLARCRGAFRALREPENAARKAAQSALRARCDMSESELAQRDADLFAARLRNGSADPISHAVDAVQSASTPAERRAAMAELLAMPLPMPALLLAALPQEEDVGYYFHGTYYKDEGVQQLMIAMQLADCALGTDCGAGSAAALSLCAGRGWCDGSVSDAVRSARPGDFAALQALATQLAQAIRQRDGAAFVPGV